MLFICRGGHAQNRPGVLIDTVQAYPKSSVKVFMRMRDTCTLLTAQGSLTYDTLLLEFTGVSGFNPALGLNAASFNVKRKGLVCFSWDDAALKGHRFAASDSLFALAFKVRGEIGSTAHAGFTLSPVIWEFSSTDLIPFVPGIRPGYVHIVKAPISIFDIRTGFSPNNDAINDTWEVFEGYPEFPDMAITVFTPEGNIAYESRGPYTPWDGTTPWGPAQEGTYYFIIDLKQGKGPVYKGHLTISR
ncbi:MAG: gliding motility-associated C-terminal domain-containing protein [Bacteroidota bacterium]